MVGFLFRLLSNVTRHDRSLPSRKPIVKNGRSLECEHLSAQHVKADVKTARVEELVLEKV